MALDPWEAIEKQRTEVIDNPPTSLDEFRDPFTQWSFFKDAFSGTPGEDGHPRIPTTYYTKPCSWASDYPFSYRRVLVFLNPGHLEDAPFDNPLNSYIQREFGCSRDTFVRLVVDGWLYPMLAPKESYPERVHGEMVDLFAEMTNEDDDIVPRFVNLVDYALGAAALKEAVNTDEFVPDSQNKFIDLTATYKAWADLLPWSNLPPAGFQHQGVIHQDLREYVAERVAKLELARRVLPEATGIGPKVDSLKEQARNPPAEFRGLHPESDEPPPAILQDTYTTWNLLGTPMYYCDFSGTTDMGQTVAQDYGGLVRQALDRVRSMATNLKRVQSYAARELDSTTVGFLEGGTLDEDVLLGISPETQAEYEHPRRTLEKRVEEHDRYYENVRGQLLDRRDDTRLSTYREVIADHNDDVASNVELGGFLSGQAQKVARWTGIATTVFTSIQPLLPDTGSPTSKIMSILAGAELVGRGLNIAGNVVNYMDEETIDRYEVPQPDDMDDVNLGSMDFWQVRYRGRSVEERIEYLADSER